MHLQVPTETRNAIHLVNMAVSNKSGTKVQFHANGTSGDYAGD